MRLIFAGTPKIAADALEELSKHHEIALVITRPDAPFGRKRVLTSSPVAQRASELGLKIVKTNKISRPELDAITGAQAELGIVVAFGSLMPKAALEIISWWNLHFSVLPKWRGATPLQHSMMTSDGMGISVFVLEVGLDTGPIIVQRSMEFANLETAGEALERFTSVGATMILEALSAMPAAKPQVGEASLAPKILRDQAKVNYQDTSIEVSRFVNALNPEPMAWIEIAGSPLRILRAQPHQLGQQFTGDFPGVGEVRDSDGKVLLGCGSGSYLELLEVQPAGKKVMTAKDWFRGQTGTVRLD
jgi:methionyl-tRNA formyltransferase